MKANGAGEMPASLAVWPSACPAAALVNILYPIFLITKNKSWVFWQELGRGGAGCLDGSNSLWQFALMGKGMLLLGPGHLLVSASSRQRRLSVPGLVLSAVEMRGVMGRPASNSTWRSSS